MSKGLWIVLVFTLTGLLATTAIATQTRVNTMGGMDIWLRDDVNMNWNPALLPWYAEQVSAEYGWYPADADWQSIGVRLTNNDEQSMGVFSLVLNPHPDVVTILPVPDPSGLSQPSDVPITWPYTSAEQNWKLMWGKRWEKLALGAAVSMGGHSEKDDSAGVTQNEEKISMLSFNPGVVLELGEESTVIDVGGRFSTTSFSNDTGAVTDENTGGTHLTVGGRAWFELTDFGYFVPGFGFNSSDMSWENKGSGFETIDKRTSLFAGAGLQVMPSEETTVLVAVYYGSLKNEGDDPFAGGDTTITWTSNTFPGWAVGVESDLTSWLTGRVGANKFSPLKSVEDGINPYEYQESETNAPFYLELGVAVHLMDFRIDGHLQPDFIFEGPDFIGGQQDTFLGDSPPFVGASIVYNFSGM